MDAILGLIMIYAIGHFFAIQYKKDFNSRTTYEAVVTWVAMISIGLLLWGIMFPS